MNNSSHIIIILGASRPSMNPIEEALSEGSRSDSEIYATLTIETDNSWTRQVDSFNVIIVFFMLYKVLL